MITFLIFYNFDDKYIAMTGLGFEIVDHVNILVNQCKYQLIYSYDRMVSEHLIGDYGEYMANYLTHIPQVPYICVCELGHHWFI